MQEHDQRQRESARTLRSSFCWSLLPRLEGALQQISDCDPLSHSKVMAGIVLGKIPVTHCAEESALNACGETQNAVLPKSPLRLRKDHVRSFFRKRFRLRSSLLADLRKFGSV
jgi:hypothetical protein